MITLVVRDRHHESVPELATILSRYTESSGTVTARVLPSEDVRRLNRDYAEQDEATDVLSFNYAEHGTPDSELGDIVISREHIESQAKAAGTDEDTEFLLLLAHGALHILGYDHQTESHRRQMDGTQRDIMRELGRTYRDFGWQS